MRIDIKEWANQSPLEDNERVYKLPEPIGGYQRHIVGKPTYSESDLYPDLLKEHLGDFYDLEND